MPNEHSSLEKLFSNDLFVAKKPTDTSIPRHHYYGNIVRRYFIAGAIVMIILLPFFSHRIPIPSYAAIFLITLIGFFAGVTNPTQLWSFLFDATVSFVAFCVFEYFAIKAYLENSWTDGFLWTNEILAGIFFIAFYFAIKSVRGYLLDKNHNTSY